MMSEAQNDMLERTANQMYQDAAGTTLSLFDPDDDNATDDFNDVVSLLEELAGWCPEEVRVVGDLARYYRRKGEVIPRPIDPTFSPNAVYGGDDEDTYVLTVKVMVPVAQTHKGPVELFNLIDGMTKAAIPPASAKALEIEQLEARIAELKGLSQ